MESEPEGPDSAESATRLEAALERIARLAHPAGADRAALAARLDRIIGRLRRALEGDA
ncbi:MAG: hypothetical protein KGI51_11715 [Rhodospirillales bacterium]|nr:hypothetical protein [Rhodospirillales bacterium]